MSKTAKRILAALLVAVMVFSCVACGSKPAAETGTTETPAAGTDTQTPAAGEKIVTMAITSAWETWNPYNASGNYTDILSDMLYDRLLITNLDGTTEPRLANSYEVAEDHTSITFKLNDTAKFCDGEPVTADDVVYSYQLDTNPDFNSLKRDWAKVFAGTDPNGVQVAGEDVGCVKVDDYTVTFNFKDPMNELPVLTMFNRYFYVVPEHVYSQYTVAELNESDTWKQNMIGSGPMIFDTTVDGVSVEFKANKDYFLGTPDFDRLIIKVVEGSQLLSGLMAGEIDVVAGAGIGSIPLSDWGTAQTTENLSTYSGGAYSYQAMIYNTQSAKMPNAEIRQALDMAINRQNIVDNLIQGEATALQTAYLPYSPYYAANLQYPTYDPEKAKQMLEEAGFDFTQTLELIVPTGNEIRIQSTVLIQQDLAAIGVKVNITQYDFPTLMDNMRKGDFDLGMCGSAGSIEPSEPLGWLNNNGSTNFPCIDDDRYVKAYSDATATVDLDEQKAKYSDIQQMMLDDMPISYLYSLHSLMAYNSNKVSNIDPEQWEQLNWCVWTWKVAQ